MLFDAVTGTCVVTLFSRRLVWALALPSINTQSMVRGSSHNGFNKYWPIRAQQNLSRPIRIAHLGQVIKLTSQCPYLVMEIHVTPWDKEHTHTRVRSTFSHSFIERRAWSTSGTPQTMKSSPRPLASQKSRKTHCCEVKKIIFCDLMKKQISNLVDKRDVCDVQVTSRPWY